MFSKVDTFVGTLPKMNQLEKRSFSKYSTLSVVKKNTKVKPRDDIPLSPTTVIVYLLFYTQGWRECLFSAGMKLNKSRTVGMQEAYYRATGMPLYSKTKMIPPTRNLRNSFCTPFSQSYEIQKLH